MTFVNRIRQYRVYRRLIMSYLVLIVMSIAVVSSILYALFSLEAVKEIDRSSKQVLSHVSYTANVVYQQIQDVSSQLLVDKDVMSFFDADEVDKLKNYRAYMIIAKVQSVYPFIKDISMYNFTNGEYIDTFGLPRDPKVNARSNADYLSFYPRAAIVDTDASLRLLTFSIVPERKLDTNTPKYALVLDLDEASIQNTIGSLNTSSKRGDTYVMNASGEVLSHSDAANFMRDFSGRHEVKRILGEGRNQGSFVQKTGGKKNLITYVRSPALDWYFVSSQPYSELLSNIHTLRSWTWIISLLLIVLGVGISLLLTGNFYNPIRRLLDQVTTVQTAEQAGGTLLHQDEYAQLTNAFLHSRQSAERLESKLNRSRRVLKSSSIVSLLQGIDKLTAEQIGEEWGKRLTGPYFRVLLFKIDDKALFKQTYPPFERELIRFAIGNIAQELLGGNFENAAAVTEDELAAILQLPDEALGDTLYLTLSEIQDAVRAYYKISVTVSIGGLCDSFAGLHDSYRSAQEYGDYRLFFGYNAIIDAERANRNRDGDLQYPTFKERKLIDAVKLSNAKSVQAGIADWISFISACTYARAMQFTNFLLLTMIREFGPISELGGTNTNGLYAYFHLIEQVETLDQLGAALTDFCGRVVTVMEENKQQVASLKSTRVIEEVKQLIEERYADACLSLEYAAGQVDLSTGYLGKLFKHQTRSTFNDYVTLVRIEQAKRLLTSTNEIVSEVGAKVGVPGAAYFSTMFKRHTGMSPSQYRENHRITG
ncbi:helix-turn-helix domain-containing protein [Paenibacillus sp. MWE-103]|uniref:Helix-turn-helix domain-containing protein n=1 Tax=Paenibacillus artemisiicola TaxID=1172618 RepID=A0ABS3W629_9BACL|nr:helix-turn-helix domain-containing protein [Paenibacillus artemisiicola]